MSVLPTSPWSESQQLPDHQALLAVDGESFTSLPSSQHAGVSELIPALLDEALTTAGLDAVRKDKRFPANTGDGIAFGFAPTLLPFLLSPGLDVLNERLARFNASSPTRLRLRVSVGLGPVSNNGTPGAGNGRHRNDLHRLLDCEQVKEHLRRSSPHATHLVAIASQRVFEDVIDAGYSGTHPDRWIEVEATLPGRAFRRFAWIYVPTPSGDLLTRPTPPNPLPALPAAALPLPLPVAQPLDVSLSRLLRSCEHAAKHRPFGGATSREHA